MSVGLVDGRICYEYDDQTTLGKLMKLCPERILTGKYPPGHTRSLHYCLSSELFEQPVGPVPYRSPVLLSLTAPIYLSSE